jgi:hypothetical protein
MMLLHLICYSLSAMVAVTPAAAPPADLHVVADSDSARAVLTADALNHMTTFWANFKKEPTYVQEAWSGGKEGRKSVSLPVGTHSWNEYDIVDMVQIVNNFPSVAADLKQVGLTAQQWNDYYRTLISTLDTQTELARLKADSVRPTSVQEQNVTFIKAHAKEITDLKSKGLYLPIYGITFGQKTKPHRSRS